MEWKTAISDVRNNAEIIRGYSLDGLIRDKSFVEVIFLLLKGSLPTENEITMLNALFVSAIDHGIGTSSTMTARIVASSGNSIHTAVAAGILTMGELHGGAIETAAHFFQSTIHERDIEGLCIRYREEGKRIPGFGHRILSVDPRSKVLFEIAHTTGIFGDHCGYALQVEEELQKKASKPLPLNIDGAMAAIISDMGFDWKLAQGFFIIARMPGLVAHVYEEKTEKKGLRRLSEDETEYTGFSKKGL